MWGASIAVKNYFFLVLYCLCTFVQACFAVSYEDEVIVMDWKHTIRQRTLSDCGVACLKMIFNDCNIPVSLEALQEQLSLNYKGVNMYELKQAALKYGLKVSALSVKKSTLAKIEKTAIVHLNKKHFVVLDSVDVEGYVHLRDPIRGRCKITTDVFFKHSEGLVLAFQCKLIK